MIVPFRPLSGTGGDPFIGADPCTGCGAADEGLNTGAVLVGDVCVDEVLAFSASIFVLSCGKSSAYLLAVAALE